MKIVNRTIIAIEAELPSSADSCGGRTIRQLAIGTNNSMQTMASILFRAKPMTNGAMASISSNCTASAKNRGPYTVDQSSRAYNRGTYNRRMVEVIDIAPSAREPAAKAAISATRGFDIRKPGLSTIVRGERPKRG